MLCHALALRGSLEPALRQRTLVPAGPLGNPYALLHNTPRMNDWRFADELNLKPVHLFRAGLLLAREIAYPKLDVAAALGRWQGLVSRAAIRLAAASAAERGEALARFLFEEEGFRGNQDAYDDPRNSFLNDVLERRLGIPITLSVLYVTVADRVGVPAYGISLPGHFVVGVRAPGGNRLLDPFHGGNPLTREDCARLVRHTTGYEGSFQAGWLAGVGPELILTRMLNNLKHLYIRTEAWAQAINVSERLAVLQPEAPGHLRDLGLLFYRRDNLPRALHYLQRYLAKAPDAPDTDAIRDGLRDAMDDWVRMN